MVLGNYVVLEVGVPKRLHLVSHTLVAKQIIDPKTKTMKMANALSFRVDREDGLVVDKEFSTLAEKLATRLEPLLVGEAYKNMEIIITKFGTDYQTGFQVETRPFSV